MKKVFLNLIVFALAFTFAVNVHATDTNRPVVFDVEYSTPRAFGIEPVPLDQVISVKFTRAIKRGSGQITFFDWKQNAIPFTEEIVGDELIITPINSLNYNTQYYVEVFSDAIENAEDNARNLFKVNQKYTINFSTPFLSDLELKQTNELLAQSSVNTTNFLASPNQPTILRFTPETNLPPVQTYTLQKFATLQYQLGSSNTEYRLWTSNPELISLVNNGNLLVVTGLNAGTAQVAVRNLADNTKVVFNVVIQ